MMMQMPMDMAPTRIASAMLCSCTISFHRWYGVSLSITKNDTMKTRIPIKAKTNAATMLPSGTRFILFPSCVMGIAHVNRTVRAGIIADGLGNIFELGHLVETHTAVLREARAAQHHDPIKKIQFAEHQSSSSDDW